MEASAAMHIAVVEAPGMSGREETQSMREMWLKKLGMQDRKKKKKKKKKQT